MPQKKKSSNKENKNPEGNVPRNNNPHNVARSVLGRSNVANGSTRTRTIERVPVNANQPARGRRRAPLLNNPHDAVVATILRRLQ